MVHLDHSMLQSVLKPARYTGGEWNAVHKDWDSVRCKFALALPDVYEVGMSNLGLAILYEILNRRADIAADSGKCGFGFAVQPIHGGRRCLVKEILVFWKGVGHNV